MDARYTALSVAMIGGDGDRTGKLVDGTANDTEGDGRARFRVDAGCAEDVRSSQKQAKPE